MYSNLVTWIKTYTDARSMSAYYDESAQPRWFMRDKVTLTRPENAEDGQIPAGMVKSLYQFGVDFYMPKIGTTTSTLTTAFTNLLRDFTLLYLYDNTITLTGGYTIKIKNISHTAMEDDNKFGYRLELDIEYWEYI